METVRKNPDERIEINSFDSRGPEIDSKVASFTIKDPDLPPTSKNWYCIGFKFLGGNFSYPKSWKYDHTNYWDSDSGLNDDELEPTLISKRQIEKVLDRHSITLRDLLAQYCQKLTAALAGF